MITTIAIQPGYGQREAMKAMDVCPRLGLKWYCGPDPDKACSAPIGSVEWCEEWLGYHPVPDYHPSWLWKWRRREIQNVRGGYERTVSRHDQFVKPANRYKIWPARIVTAGHDLPDSDFVMSHVVEFAQEWRYYVSDGAVVATGWYDGNDEDEPAPDLNIEWPATFCGAADFGRLKSGEIAIVESHHPYACGWYGEDHEAFIRWVVRGWEYMLSLHRPQEFPK